MNAATADTCSPPPSASGQTTKPQDQATDKMIPERLFYLHTKFSQSLQNRLFCPRTDFSASRVKGRLKSSHHCISAPCTSHFKNREVTNANSTLQKARISTFLHTFFGMEFHPMPPVVSPNTTRPFALHVVSLFPQGHDPLAKSTRKEPFSDLFPECAIIDIMKAKDT